MNNSNALWKWRYIGGVFIAGLASALSFHHKILALVFIIVGILVGIFTLILRTSSNLA